MVQNEEVKTLSGAFFRRVKEVGAMLGIVNNLKIFLKNKLHRVFFKIIFRLGNYQTDCVTAYSFGSLDLNCEQFFKLIKIKVQDLIISSNVVEAFVLFGNVCSNHVKLLSSVKV